MADMKYTVGIDLGGTFIKAGLVEIETRRILSTASVPTNAPRAAELIADDMADISKKVCAEGGVEYSEIEFIGVATPGIVKSGVVVAATNLGWENADLAKLINERTGKTVYVANDANTAAYAEAMWGSGEGASSLAAFTLGTGVGGGIVLDGKILEGFNGFAAELGHFVVEPTGRDCGCGKRGCLEAYCSANALARSAKEAMLEDKDSAMWQIAGGSLDNVTAKTPFDAKALGDKAGTAVVESFINYLAIGVSNIINIIQPEVVCVGGGVCAQGDNLLVPLREKVGAMSFGVEGGRTRVEIAKFKNEAGIIGAALLGVQEVN